MAKGTNVGPNVGTSKAPAHAIGAHNFQRSYYDHLGTTGDVRAHYEDLYFSKAGSGGGEVLRARGIANAAGVASGATINAIHATGRVASGATVSGALSGIRATLEVAGTTPTPGGTLAALQVDVNSVSGTVWGLNDAFIRVTESGTALMKNLFNIESTAMTDGSNSPADHLVSSHADVAATHLIKCRVNGADMWLLAANAHT